MNSKIGRLVIRKATAHGLGHMMSPYPDPDRKRVGRIGVHLWQEDLWRAIIEAHDRGRPDQPDLDQMPNIDLPAASRYAATNQTLLSWFKGYNSERSHLDQVRPFNFLLAFQAKSRMELAATAPDALADPAWQRRSPNPASRYSSNLILDPPQVFDRANGQPIPWAWLKTYRRALVRHHLHSELKFRGGEDAESGSLQRRHVQVWALIPIGKEADNLEERETLGEDSDDILTLDLDHPTRAKLLGDVEDVLRAYRIADRTLIEKAHVSHHTLSDLRKGKRVTQQSLLRIAQALEELRQVAAPIAREREDWRQVAVRLRDEVGGRNRLAKMLGVSAPYLGRVLGGEKPMTAEMVERLIAVAQSADGKFDMFKTRTQSR